MNHCGAALACSVLVSSAACAGPDAGSDAGSEVPVATVRDSAGISIIENGPLESAPLHELGAPALELGMVDGPPELLFSSVFAVALLDDGRIAVADRSNEIRYFGPDGAYLGSFGREGDGPGEFRGIRGMWQRDDGALVVLDGELWRLTVISGAEVVASHPVRPPGMNPPRRTGMFADGSVMVHENLFDIPDSGYEPIPSIVRRVTLDELPPDTVFEGNGPSFGQMHWSDGGSIVTSPLFESGLLAAAGGETLVVSECRMPEYRELAPDGTLRRIVRWEAGDRTVQAEDVEALRQARLAEDDNAEDRRRTEEYMDGSPVNELFPACGALRAIAGGQVWVRAYAYLPDAPADWSVFEDGKLAAGVRLPPGSRLMAIGDERLVTVERDELEVEHVKVYALPAQGW